MEIVIPFNAWSTGQILAGRKTSTCRIKLYGYTGDTFRLEGRRYLINHVYVVTLERVRMEFYRQEGCMSPEEFEEVWIRIHPRKGYSPNQRVYLYLFQYIVNGERYAEGHSG